MATLPQIKEVQKTFAQTDKKGALSLCVPNQTTGNATITYEIYVEGEAEILIYNVMGQLLRTLPQGKLKTGYYEARINLSGLSVGMYHYSLLINGERADTKKLLLN